MWFENLTGFQEENPEQVRQYLEVESNTLTSLINGAQYQCGQLEVVRLQDLRGHISLSQYQNEISLSERVGDVQVIHQDPANEGAIFQAASQFNLLEMVSPNVTPEQGIDGYENDRTQGPACAIACGAGTIYRNYFARVNGKIGQTKFNQIDCLDAIGQHLNNNNESLWKMRNGYALATEAGLQNISQQIHSKTKEEYEALKGQLKIGLQWDTEVTLGKTSHLVTQAYCSALPVAYSSVSSNYWKDFAILILEATYEATLFAALKNFQNTNNPNVYLTLVGGGAFGNKSTWIFDAIKKAITQFKNTPLNVQIVSYGSSNGEVRNLINSI